PGGLRFRRRPSGWVPGSTGRKSRRCTSPRWSPGTADRVIRGAIAARAAGSVMRPYDRVQLGVDHGRAVVPEGMKPGRPPAWSKRRDRETPVPLMTWLPYGKLGEMAQRFGANVYDRNGTSVPTLSWITVWAPSGIDRGSPAKRVPST